MLRAQVLVATLWVGSLWTISYIVAPTLFAMLPEKALAGTIAGELFRIQAWLSIVCAAVLMSVLIFGHAGDGSRHGKILLSIVSAMLICTLIGYFGLQPEMAALRESAGSGGVMDPDVRMKFGVLHGISAGFTLLQSLLGIALILKVR